MDSKDLKILAVLAVLAVVVIAAVAIMGGGNGGQDESEKEDPAPVPTVYGKVTYTAEECKMFLDKNGYIKEPDLGKKFVVVEYRLENLCYNGTITANPVYFQLEIDGVRYGYDSSTFSHIDYVGLPELTIGSKIDNVVVFEVKSTLDISDMKLAWDGVPSNGIEIVNN